MKQVIALVLNSENNVIIVKLTDLQLGVVWCNYNEQKNSLRIYRRLLTNHWRGKVAELCLEAYVLNSENNL